MLYEVITFECFQEGKAAQILYVGPYSEEGSTIEKIHAFIKDSGYMLSGKHHEIYLNNPNTTTDILSGIISAFCLTLFTVLILWRKLPMSIVGNDFV